MDQVDGSGRIISTRGHCRVDTARNRLVGSDPALGSSRTAPTSELLPGRFRRSRQQSYNLVSGVSRVPARSRFQLSVRAAGDIREHGLVSRRPADSGQLPARIRHMPTGRGLRDRKSRKGAGVRTASTDFPVHCDRPRSDADLSELRAWSRGYLDLPGRGRASAWSTGKCAGADHGRGLRKTIYGVCLFGVAADADGVGSLPASEGLTGDMVQTDRTCCDRRDIALRAAGNCVWC